MMMSDLIWYCQIHERFHFILLVCTAVKNISLCLIFTCSSFPRSFDPGPNAFLRFAANPASLFLPPLGISSTRRRVGCWGFPNNNSSSSWPHTPVSWESRDAGEGVASWGFLDPFTALTIAARSPMWVRLLSTCWWWPEVIGKLSSWWWLTWWPDTCKPGSLCSRKLPTSRAMLFKVSPSTSLLSSLTTLGWSPTLWTWAAGVLFCSILTLERQAYLNLLSLVSQ